MVSLIRRRWERRRHDARGAMAIMVAICTVIVFILAALVIDVGMARATKRQAQNAADSAALAGGTALYVLGKTPKFDEAVAAAKSYAGSNFDIPAGAWASCVDAAKLTYVHAAGGTECISFDSATAPTKMRVQTPIRQVSTPLASVVGGPASIRVSGAAEINVTPNVKSRCALCVLGAGPHNLQNGQLVVSGGDVHFNGSVDVGPNGLVATDGSITVQGAASGGLDKYQPDPQTGVAAITDPLAFMPPIDYAALTAKSDPCTGGPGIYGTWSGSCSALQPGLYVITGEWKFAGSETVIGNGVTLYFTCGTAAAPAPCSSGQQGGKLSASGNGTIQLSAPTSGALKGLVVVYDRNNASPLLMTGNGASSYSGTIYAPSATLDYRGNAAGTPDSLVVVASISFSGSNASLQPEYDESNNVDMPPADLHLSR